LLNVTVPVTVVPAGASLGRTTVLVKSGCKPVNMAVLVLLVVVVSGMLVVPTPATTVLVPTATVSVTCAVVLAPGLKVIELVPTVVLPLTV